MVTSVVEPPYLRGTPPADVLCKVRRYFPAETLILLVSRHSFSTEMCRDRRFDLLQGNRPYVLLPSISLNLAVGTDHEELKGLLVLRDGRQSAGYSDSPAG